MVKVWNISALKGKGTTVVIGHTSVDPGKFVHVTEKAWNRVKNMDILHAGPSLPAKPVEAPQLVMPAKPVKYVKIPPVPEKKEQPPQPAKLEEVEDYSSYTKKRLVQVARNKGIKLPKNATKATILELVEGGS